MDFDRRRFMHQAGIGSLAAGTAWVAPSVLGSSMAWATPSACVNQTLHWTNYAGTIGSSFSRVITTGATNTTFGLSYTDPTSAVQSSTSDNIFARTGMSETYHMQLKDSGAGPATITLTFSPAVTNLAFSLLDVDSSTSPANTSTWIDRVDVSGANGATPVAGTGTPGGNVTTIVANREYSGSNNTANSGATASDIAFAFTGPITTVTIVYSRAGAIQSQGIGISDLTWCG